MTRIARIRLLVLAGILLLPASLVFSQEAQPQQSPAAAEHATDKNSASEQVEHASKDASGEEADETAAFRRSPAVQWVAKKTGLGVEKAYWLSVVINFLVVFGFLWFMLRKFLPTLFRQRTESIQKRMEEARKASEEARRRLADVEGRLSRLDTEIAQMRNEADAAAHNEEQRLMTAAEEERRRIVQSAEQEISMAANAARRELKAYAADLAVSLAEKKIQVPQSADQALVREFTARIGKDGR